MYRLWCLSLLMTCGAALAAITPPAPPPELPESLTDFRTREQLLEAEGLTSEQDQVEELEIPDSPFVPGDDSTGVVRLSGLYVPSQVVSVPPYGMTLMRFYDLNNVPWDIKGARVEQPGYLAEVTAAPSELMLRQRQGATATTMAVTLEGLEVPLVFSLRPFPLRNNGAVVSTVLNVVRVRSVRDSKGYIPSPAFTPAQPNPRAAPVSFGSVDHAKVRTELVEAVRLLRAEQHGGD
ncbi:MAG: hypothetical protein K6A65_08755 [Succinivibrionaceae bacterium]|nr:hypothetical protein [Succinivibrionaceae bacterium]